MNVKELCNNNFNHIYVLIRKKGKTQRLGSYV